MPKFIVSAPRVVEAEDALSAATKYRIDRLELHKPGEFFVSGEDGKTKEFFLTNWSFEEIDTHPHAKKVVV